MTYETILREKQDGIGLVTLNRPQSMNALSVKLKAELARVMDELEEDEAVRVVVLTGTGKAFCAGTDIKERSQTKMTSPGFYFSQRKTQALFTRIEEFTKPVISAINGLAVGGGCELCLACDLRVASDNARFGFTEVRLGAMPAGGGTQRLPRLIGVARAKELLFLGDLIDAGEAYRVGLVNKVVRAEELMVAARQMAQRLAEHPPLSIRLIKRAVNVGLQLDMASAVDYETQCAAVLIETEDRKEGFRAFVEKRKPEFKGC